MLYYFIINGRSDKSHIRPELDGMLEGVDIERQFFVSRGLGDATRFVNMHCDLNPKDEVCFVACGGAGTANEVASALAGRENKYLAILNFGGTNDYTKCYPERDFHSLKALLAGERKKVDIIRANDNFSLNLIEFGLGAYAAVLADYNIRKGVENAYKKAVLSSLFRYRYNRMTVYADGERMNRRAVLLGTLANGKYSAGRYLSAPRAVDDDGLMEVMVMKPMILAFVAIVIRKYEKGLHLDNWFCRLFIKYRRARHVELKSNDLIYLSLDGEIIASSSFRIDVLEKSITLILPKAE
ncbi:MAG: hypothetical protein KBS38_02800 [Bacteroidales bacterium]|nr:hypothetical protein [Candidatus Cacconaster caballi]